MCVYVCLRFTAVDVWCVWCMRLVLSLFSARIPLRLFMKLVFLRNIHSTVHCSLFVRTFTAYSTATVVVVVVQLNCLGYCCCFFRFFIVFVAWLVCENDVKLLIRVDLTLSADDDDELILKKFFICSTLNENFYLVILSVARQTMDPKEGLENSPIKKCMLSIQLAFWVKMEIRTIQMSSKHFSNTLSNK